MRVFNPSPFARFGSAGLSKLAAFAVVLAPQSARPGCETKAPSPTRCEGADRSAPQDRLLSEAHGRVDWTRIRSPFVYLRASAGLDADACFHRAWSFTGQRGLPRGAWHQLDSSASVEAQAQLFLKRLEHRAVQRPPLLVIPQGAPKGARALAQRWLRLVEAKTSTPPQLLDQRAPRPLAPSPTSSATPTAVCLPNEAPAPEDGIDLVELIKRNPERTYGFDISHHQGIVDWTKARASGARFVFMKASEGRTFKDDCFARNWRALADSGIQRGAYHYFTPSVDGELQAEHFLRQVERAGGLQDDDLPPVVDLENAEAFGKVGPKKALARVQAFCRVVEARTGRAPMIYTGRNFWRRAMRNTRRLASHPLWVVDIGGLPEPRRPSPWRSWDFWQFTFKGLVPGISGPVDLDLKSPEAIGHSTEP